MMTGSRKVTFDDVPAEVLQAAIAAMLVSKEHRGSIRHLKIFRELSTDHVFRLVEFSRRLLMPWIGICGACIVMLTVTTYMYIHTYTHSHTHTHTCTTGAHAAVLASKGTELLLGLVGTRSKMFDGTEDESEWKEVLSMVPARLANIVEEAVLSPAFPSIDVDLLESVCTHMKSSEWHDEAELSVVYCDGAVDSPVNKDGLYLQVEENQDSQMLGVFIRIVEGDMPNLLKMGLSQVTVVNFVITGRAREGENEVRTAVDTAISSRSWTGWPNFLLAADKERFMHNNSPPTLKLSFKTQTSRLHRQAFALVNFFAGKLNISPEKVSVEDAWRYFRSSGPPAMAEILRECLCRSFSTIQIYERNFSRSLSCTELENIISHGRLETYNNEVRSCVWCGMRVFMYLCV
jgi:hypothetical protein